MEFTEFPAPEDILPRNILVNGDVASLALAIQPWALRTKQFTFVCFAFACGITHDDLARREYLVEKARLAFRALNCRSVGRVNQATKLYEVDPDRHLSPVTRVTREGFSENADMPLPQPFQIEVVKAWLKEYARPTVKIKTDFSTDSLRRLVSAWTEHTRAYELVEQQNEFTGERYFSPKVYITNGAFLQAALDDGYLARRVGTTRDAHFNLSYRKLGKNWIGRPAKAPAPKGVDAPKPRRRLVSKPKLDVDKLMMKLRPYLDAVRVGAEARGEEPFFELTEAAKAAGVRWKRGTVPLALRKALWNLGCLQGRIRVRGKRMKLWYRRSDLPKRWYGPTLPKTKKLAGLAHPPGTPTPMTKIVG